MSNLEEIHYRVLNAANIDELKEIYNCLLYTSDAADE